MPAAPSATAARSTSHDSTVGHHERPREGELPRELAKAEQRAFAEHNASARLKVEGPHVGWATNTTLTDPTTNQRALEYNGSRMSRMVLKPGAAAITAGIAFTTIDAVAMSPGTPPSILECVRGNPSISTES